MGVIEVNQGDFEEKILKSDIPVLVDFWAPWCGPCHVMAPILEEFANENEGKLNVGKLNVDDNREIAVQYNITGIPTMILFVDGEPAETIVGVIQKQELASRVGSHLAG